MPRSKTLALVALGWMMAVLAHAATVEEARRLYQNGDPAAAEEELLEVLALESEGSIRAQALDLLGMIAVDKGDFDLATAVWEKLINDFPDSAEASQARTKLSLATELNEVRADVPDAERAPTPVEAETTPAAPIPTSVEEPDDRAASRPAAEAEAAEPASPAATKPRAEQSNLVLVAGRGKPHDGAQRAANLIIEHLQSRGVAAESATKGVPVVESSTQVVPALLRQVEDEGGHSLLLISANFESFAKILIECYTPDGVVVWKKKVTGGTGFTGRPYSATGVNEKLVERVLDKLDGQVGGPCLPTSG